LGEMYFRMIGLYGFKIIAHLVKTMIYMLRQLHGLEGFMNTKKIASWLLILIFVSGCSDSAFKRPKMSFDSFMSQYFSEINTSEIQKTEYWYNSYVGGTSGVVVFDASENVLGNIVKTNKYINILDGMHKEIPKYSRSLLISLDVNSDLVDSIYYRVISIYRFDGRGINKEILITDNYKNCVLVLLSEQ
jgi:hypothetical protein